MILMKLELQETNTPRNEEWKMKTMCICRIVTLIDDAV